MKSHKILTLFATTLLLVPTLSNGVNALEDNTQTEPTQEIATNPEIEENNTPQEETTQTQQETPVEDVITTLPNPAPTPVLAQENAPILRVIEGESGVWGDEMTGASWTLTTDGVLTIGSGVASGTKPWDRFNKLDVSEIVFTGTVTLGAYGAESLFEGLKNLTAIRGIENLDTSRCVSMYQMFFNCQSLTDLDLSTLNTSHVTDMSYMFLRTKSLNKLKIGFDTTQVTDMTGMFYGASALLDLDLSTFDTSKVTDMEMMFMEAESLHTVNLSSFNTAKVGYMNGMFLNAKSLTNLDLSTFDTSHVVSMGEMFMNTTSLKTLDVHTFDTSKVNNMINMFSGAGLITLDVSSFNTSQITSMYGMFSGTSSLTTLDLSSFNTARVTSMEGMFEGSGITSIDVSNFDTRTVWTMANMFKDASSLETLDLSSFYTPVTQDFGHAFDGCSALVSLDIRNMSFRLGMASLSMFNACTSLQYLTLGENVRTSGLAATMLPSVSTTGIYNGWWANLSTGQTYGSSAEFMMNYEGASPGVYEWVMKNYNLTCDVSDGTVTENLPTSYSPNTETTLPTATKSGYVFKGWFDDKGVKWDNIPAGTVGDLALTAQFRVGAGERIEAQNIAPTIQKGTTYKWKISDHTPSYYNDDDEKVETTFYAKLNGKVYTQNDTVELTEGEYTIEITNKNPLTRGVAITTTAKIIITSVEPNPNPALPETDESDLTEKILDIIKDYNLNDDVQNNITKEIEEKAKNGILSLEDIKQIIQKHAPNLSASELEELAGKLYKLLYPNSALLPSTNEAKQAGLTLLGVALLGLGLAVFMIRRKRKI